MRTTTALAVSAVAFAAAAAAWDVAPGGVGHAIDVVPLEEGPLARVVAVGQADHREAQRADAEAKLHRGRKPGESGGR